MGTVCQLRLCGVEADAAESAARRAIDEVRRIEAKYSRYRPDSIVSRINAAAGSGRPVAVDVETAGLLGFAAQLFDASAGLFDITSGILRRVWDFKAARVPAPDAVRALLPLIGWRQVGWDGASVSLARAGMELDFGGFGKEYAADRAATVLREAGVPGGTVNLGGDVCLIGPAADGSPWRLGIAHPREPGGVIASIELTHGALATSGDYERAFVEGGRRYCHILNPHTGWPVSHWQSVSVAGPTCLAAGALTTIAMLIGDGAHDFLREQGVDFLTIDGEGAIHRESGTVPA
ncbi:FAD:protein FMN transferase [Rhizobacter sp. LjRoot28]|uniref:FAD:protein FMN transferase n=1 Tax=Rhizobacter sp. LjRoot28 TaxID=3342309 RepID=UPI003ED0ADF4